MLKTGIVGCGNIAKIHFAALKGLEDVEIVAAVDSKIWKEEKPIARNMKIKRFICIHIFTHNVGKRAVRRCAYLHTALFTCFYGSGSSEKGCSRIYGKAAGHF